jgi:hypothetical protein
VGRTLDSRLATLLRAASPRGEPDPVEAPEEGGRGRIVVDEQPNPASLSRAARRLAGDGLLAVTGSGRALRAARRTLEAEGLAHRGTFLRSDRALVHASRKGRRLLLEQSVLSRSRRLALQLAPDALASQVALFTRRDGPPPLDWASSPGENGAAALVAGHRTESVAVRLDDAGLFAKWATDPERLERAYENCLAFAPAARAAGFDVPEPRLLRLGTAAALVADARTGETAAALLRRRPGDLRLFADRLISTLEAWNLGSREVMPFGGTEAARQLASDLAVVEPHLEPALVAALRRRLDEVSDQATPVAPAHGDVSMWNVVVGPHGLTLVDWEAARPQLLPGFDAEYALVDATAAASAYSDRVAAFARGDVKGLRERIVATTGVPPSLAALAPVATWAHHAANELRNAGDDGSFLAILRLVLADVAR